MSVEMLKNLLSDSDMEIAGHGYYHQNSKEDIIKGVESLCELLETDSLYKGANGFASPYAGLSKKELNKIWKDLQSSHITYVRLSLRYKTYKLCKILARKLSRIIKCPFLYSWAYKDTLMDKVSEGLLYSIPVLATVTFEQLKAVIKKAIKEKNACILMFHSIVEKGNISDNWDYEIDKFESLCAYLADCQGKGLLEVATSMNIYNKLKG